MYLWGGRDNIAEQIIWNDGSDNGSRFGPSDLFDLPDWQHGPGIDEHSPTLRLIPDIALFADDATPGIAFYERRTFIDPTPHWIDADRGTSASKPCWSAWALFESSSDSSRSKHRSGS